MKKRACAICDGHLPAGTLGHVCPDCLLVSMISSVPDSDPPKRFSITPTGDPFNATGWDVHEHESEDNIAIFRGDLSPIQGKSNAKATLQRLYPGCQVRVED